MPPTPTDVPRARPCQARHHEPVSSTPLWVPLVVAGVGVAGTLTAGIVGGLITQRRADQREADTWARERRRERERWAREDEALTFEHRREAFLEFYVEVKARARKAYEHSYGFTDEEELPEGWQDDAAEKLHRLEFYADRPVAAAASAAYGAAWSWGVYGKYGGGSSGAKCCLRKPIVASPSQRKPPSALVNAPRSVTETSWRSMIRRRFAARGRQLLSARLRKPGSRRTSCSTSASLPKHSAKSAPSRWRSSRVTGQVQRDAGLGRCGSGGR